MVRRKLSLTPGALFLLRIECASTNPDARPLHKTLHTRPSLPYPVHTPHAAPIYFLVSPIDPAGGHP